VNPGGAEDYLERFTDALDRPISLGFIVPADRAEIPEVAVATFPRRARVFAELTTATRSSSSAARLDGPAA
jgi:hypothetical protein